tara:strand:- start:139 stop:348 length:210 start_codon:yes stop_codon:yes gene_type:complete
MSWTELYNKYKNMSNERLTTPLAYSALLGKAPTPLDDLQALVRYKTGVKTDDVEVLISVLEAEAKKEVQ